MISRIELNALKREAILLIKEGRTGDAINTVFRAFQMIIEELNKKEEGGEGE